MQDVSANTAKNTGQKTTIRPPAHESTSLDGRYRQIGISAVAAAVRYQGLAKNPAYAPVAVKWQDLAEEVA
jgi:hypothetical protein